MTQRDRREYFKQYERTRKEEKTAYNQHYYQDNPTRFTENARRREQEMREFIQQLKIGL